MSSFGAFQRWLHLKHYQLELTFGVYMYTPWEKFAFYSILFLLSGLGAIAAALYLPHHIFFLCGRAWYYINGEHIDVGASAREAVKEMTAGVLNGGSTGATEVVRETVEVVREL
ncbi:small subunit of serine palmitoyltransferase-like domain-containing protein [Sarocladium implicatum]|nr:small subunit of serine palmitoyltransferase-like domain-containing protein [Sarocladium implicatum]